MHMANKKLKYYYVVVHIHVCKMLFLFRRIILCTAHVMNIIFYYIITHYQS